jgi:hypothetical protein
MRNNKNELKRGQKCKSNRYGFNRAKFELENTFGFYLFSLI